MNRPGDYTCPNPTEQPTCCLPGCERLRWLEALVKDRDELLHRIHNPTVEKHFAGTRVRVPQAGDVVRVRSGEDIGEKFTVLTVLGNVYRFDQQVFVDHPSGEPTWYYPWDLEVLG